MSGEPEPRRKLPAIIGGSGRNDGAGEQPDSSLAPCPCSSDGVWYRVKPPAPPERGRAIGIMTADDTDCNLCDACFALCVSDERRGEWKRLDTEHRINQDRGYDAFAPDIPQEKVRQTKKRTEEASEEICYEEDPDERSGYQVHIYGQGWVHERDQPDYIKEIFREMNRGNKNIIGKRSE